MGSIVMVMIGVGIIWFFRSVMPSEAFIVSERHRESFSTINYAELARKTLEEAVLVYAQTGTAKAGAAGGLDNSAPQKDEIAIWKTAPSEDAIRDMLKRYVVNEVHSSLEGQQPILGKFLTIDYGDTNIQIIPDNADFSKSEKFYVKGDKEIEVSKGMETQAIKIATGMKGHIDQEIKLKYFALYDAAKQFLNSGEPAIRINAAFKPVNTEGAKTNLAPKCEQPVTFCDSADLFSNVCQVSEAVAPTDAEVLATTAHPTLNGIPISGFVADVPFASFNAKFEKYGTLASAAGYNPLTDETSSTGSCSFSCNYKYTEPCAKKAKECVPAENPEEEPVCIDKCVPGEVIKSQTCPGVTKTRAITFTFLVDAYEKYSSEDPNGLVPSTSLHNVAVVAKLLPYDTLKFNYLTHSCTTVKNGFAATELKENAAVCQMPSGITNRV